MVNLNSSDPAGQATSATAWATNYVEAHRAMLFRVVCTSDADSAFIRLASR